MYRRTLAGLALAGLAAPSVLRAQSSQGVQSSQERLVFTLKDGDVTIQFRPDVAPLHVERVKTLTRQGFYDGTPFHRVIEGFMAQGGDPSGTGTRGSSLPDLKAEFTTRYRFLRGTVGAARTQNPDSANSQFYIMFAPAPNLDGNYTIWGQVIGGMDAVDKIKRGSGRDGIVQQPDRLLKARLVNA